MNRVFEKKSDAEILALAKPSSYLFDDLMQEINVVDGEEGYEEYVRDLKEHKLHVMKLIRDNMKF